ncbi:hypothetical protein L598_000100001890 [Mesorhizobium sp. J18]|uniref:hypothetical protein n=1 Tax=Mesorhizobium sp. J18 TaxID=935263 RepID=UPI00119B2A38|nr:hypothetical protein [Mesorhizobium sp. J18]TWH01208.1 hypothetical protein L598_000100001890 [Mesorhizobium sp. J18]
MIPFAALHRLAAARGDGLRPEFVRLFEEQAQMAANPDILPLPREFEESGPVPVAVLPETLPETVIIFEKSQREQDKKASGSPVTARRKKNACSSR